ncbi:MAG: carboxypeptidase-like regulatory domain-containing protein [Edaphobacter sp.]
MLRTRMCAVVVALLVMAASGQAPDNAAKAFGSVSGRVYCADTNAVARTARVLLVPVPVDSGAAESHGESGVSLPGAGTDFDGAFRINKVPVGEYYIYAVLPGYVDVITEFSEKELQSTDRTVSDRVRQKVTTVLVTENTVADVQLSIERAGSISGTVRYDDGTPVADATITLLEGAAAGETRPKLPTPVKMASAFLFDQVGATTDDRGRFRVASIPEGKYSAKATIAAPKRLQYMAGKDWVNDSGNQMKISVFLGDSLHWKDAGVLTLGSGEEKAGVDITVPTHGLHTISGMVEAKTDGHPINAGTVRLVGVDDPSIQRAADLQDGSFEFDLVPEGHYSIGIDNAKDQKGRLVQVAGRLVFVEDVLRKFGKVETTALVQTTDVTDLVLAAPPAKGN